MTLGLGGQLIRAVVMAEQLLFNMLVVGVVLKMERFDKTSASART